ncbi:hypothetical protein ACJZ2D_012492 [Fusarium nematophilum]
MGSAMDWHDMMFLAWHLRIGFADPSNAVLRDNRLRLPAHHGCVAVEGDEYVQRLASLRKETKVERGLEGVFEATGSAKLDENETTM